VFQTFRKEIQFMLFCSGLTAEMLSCFCFWTFLCLPL